MSATLAAGNGRELSNPPSDGISNLRFSNHSDHLLVSSWDRSVRLCDACANVLKGEFMNGGPVLDCCFHDDSSGFSACADHTVRRCVFSSGNEDILGRHDGPVCCVEYSYAAGYALSSVEGRIAMVYFDMSEVGQAKKYAFKCHRKSEAGRDTVYPVNAIAFHPIYGTFATGGCDGFVNVWDGNNKKRLYQYSKYPSSVAALSFSKDGRLLAVASSYTFEEGDVPIDRKRQMRTRNNSNSTATNPLSSSFGRPERYECVSLSLQSPKGNPITCTACAVQQGG